MKKIANKAKLILILSTILIILFGFINESYALSSPTKIINSIVNLLGGLVSLLIWIPKLLITGAFYIATKILSDSFITSFQSLPSGVEFSPFSIFFGKYDFLSVDFFNVTGKGTRVSAGSVDPAIIPGLRENVAQWFYILRLIATGALLCVLIYIAIRMILSTVASEKARYQKMFVDWLASLALIYVLQYFMIFIIAINSAVVNALETMISTSSQLSAVMSDILMKSLIGIGIDSILSFFIYVYITLQTVFFLIAYLMRVLKTGFLILISPLISITYSIDKIGDGKAQALNAWLKEFVYTILTQPFHCILYLAFANTAVSLLNGTSGDPSAIPFLDSISNSNQLMNGILAILCFRFIKDGEKILRKIFNFQNDDSSTSFASGAIAAAAIAKTTGKFASKGAAGAKAVKTYFPAAKNEIASVIAGSAALNKLKESKVGKTASKVKTKVSTGTNRVKETLKASENIKKVNKLADKTIKGARSLNGKLRNFSKTRTARAMKKGAAFMTGTMAMATMYALGENALSAYGMGFGAFNKANSVMNQTKFTEAAFQNDNNIILDEKELAELNNNLDAVNDNLDDLNSDLKEENDKLNEANTDLEEKQIALEAAKKCEEQLKNRLNTEKLSKTGRKKLEGKYEQAKKDRQKAEQDLKKSQDNLNAINTNIENLGKEIEGAKQTRAQLEDNIRKFDTDEATLARIKKRESYGDNDLNAQKNKILALIVKLQKQRELDTANEVDQKKQYHYSTNKAVDATNNIVNGIDRTILDGSNSFNLRDYMHKVTGVESDRDGTIGAELAKACDDYEKMARQKEVAKSFERMNQVNVSSEKHARNMLDTMRDKRSRTREVTG